jgi:dihydroxyacetone kinase-like protein
VKKVLNDPRDVVPEVLEGLVAASRGNLRLVDGTTAVVRTRPLDGKVGLLIGGGSGHEPLFGGFVGEGLADGAACGNVFAAPAPAVILDATRALDGGRGVLYVYGNYAGDNLSFDAAAELAAAEGIATETVRVWDDVASAPPDRIEDRRGIAGDLPVIKIAGAVSVVAETLADAARVTRKARDATRSLGVALAAGSIPETGQPTFELGPDEIEIGMGPRQAREGRPTRRRHAGADRRRPRSAAWRQRLPARKRPRCDDLDGAADRDAKSSPADGRCWHRRP